MGLESATYIDQLVGTNPTGTDDKNQGDNHLRLIKNVLQSQFPNLGTAAMTATAAELNDLIDNNRGTPSGAILMWSGTTGNIPTGWFLCNGNNGTPNLTSKFIRASTVAGNTGGANTHTHTASQAGHTHTVADEGWGTSGTDLGTVTSGKLVVGSGSPELGQVLDSLRAAGGDLTTSSTTPAITVASTEAVPEYYSLIFIMKA